MPRLNGDQPAARLPHNLDTHPPAAQQGLAATGGGAGAAGPAGALPFAAFAEQHLPQLREETTATLATMPGLSTRQKEATLALVMETASEAYTHVCSFQAQHADDLERRSAPPTPAPKPPTLKHKFQALGDKIKSGLRGTDTARHAQAQANRALWDTGSARSPFMQVAAGQVQHMVDGLLARVGQEASGASVRRVIPAAGDRPLPLHKRLAYAKEAVPATALLMPYVPSPQAGTLALHLAKNHLAASVLDKFMAPAPEKLDHDGAALLAITADAQGKITDLAAQTRSPTADLTPGLKKIVEGMAQRLHSEIGPRLGLSAAQAQQEAAGSEAEHGAVPTGTGHTLGLATGVLKGQLQRAALVSADQPLSAALWHAAAQVEGLGLSANAPHPTGAHRAGGASGAPPPTPAATQKQLQLDTSKLLQQAGAQADLTELQAVVAEFQPLVTQRMQDNQTLWGQCSPADFQAAQGMVSQTVRSLPTITALGLAVYLPEVLKQASEAQLHNPTEMGDMVTRLALAWGGSATKTGLAALEEGFAQMLAKMDAHAVTRTGAGPATIDLSAGRAQPSGAAPFLHLALMLGGRAAAAQVLLTDPAALGRLEGAMALMLQDQTTAPDDSAAMAVKKTIWNTRALATMTALSQGADRAGAPAAPAPPPSPLAQGQITVKEVLARAAKVQSSPTQQYAAALQGEVADLQHKAALSITEKAAQCGHKLAVCLLENAGDVNGLNRLREFDAHSNKAVLASEALGASGAVLTTVTASRLQLEGALKGLAGDAPEKKAALRGFNNLPLVKHNAIAHAEQQRDQRFHQANSHTALTALLQALTQAMPKNAQGQPEMDGQSKSFLSAYLNFAARGNPAAASTLNHCLDAVSGGPASTLMNHLKGNNTFGANQLSILVRTSRREIANLSQTLRTLQSDAAALKNGDFEGVRDTAAALKNVSAAGVAHSAAGAAPPRPAARQASAEAVVRDVTLSLTGIDLHAPPLDRTQHQSGASGGPAGPVPSPPARPPFGLSTQRGDVRLPVSQARAARLASTSAYAEVGASAARARGPREEPLYEEVGASAARARGLGEESAYAEVGASAARARGPREESAYESIDEMRRPAASLRRGQAVRVQGSPPPLPPPPPSSTLRPRLGVPPLPPTRPAPAPAPAPALESANKAPNSPGLLPSPDALYGSVLAPHLRPPPRRAGPPPPEPQEPLPPPLPPALALTPLTSAEVANQRAGWRLNPSLQEGVGERLV